MSGWAVVFVGYGIAAVVWLVFMFIARRGLPEDR